MKRFKFIVGHMYVLHTPTEHIRLKVDETTDTKKWLEIFNDRAPKGSKIIDLTELEVVYAK